MSNERRHSVSHNPHDNSSAKLFADMDSEDKDSFRPPRLSPETGIRQEVLNILVAQLLEEQGLIAAPEQIFKNWLGSRRMPDVIVDFRGLRLAVEGEFDSPRAQEKASKAALKRVEEGIAHIGVALIYPVSLRSQTGESRFAKRALAEASLLFAIVTESEATQQELPLEFHDVRKNPIFQFMRGDINALADALRRSYESLVKDEVLEKAVSHIQQGMNSFITSVLQQPATTARFSAALGIKELPKPKRKAIVKEEE